MRCPHLFNSIVRTFFMNTSMTIASKEIDTKANLHGRLMMCVGIYWVYGGILCKLLPKYINPKSISMVKMFRKFDNIG